MGVLIGLPMQVPILQPDEGSYLVTARLLAGRGPESGLPFYPGYSALLIPVALARSWGTQYGLALLANAVLFSFGCVLLLRLVRVLAPGTPEGRAVAITAAAATFSGWMVYVPHLLSENAFITVLLLLGVMLVEYLERPSSMRLLSMTVVAGLSVSIHPRAVVLPIAVLLVVWLLPTQHGRTSRFWVASLVPAAVGAGAAMWLITVATDDRFSTYTTDTMFDAAAAVRLPAVAAGQFLYVMAATLGLAALAGSRLSSRIRCAFRRKERSPEVALCTFIGVVTVGLGVFSVLAGVATGNGADALFHGRYLDPALLLVLVVALVELHEPRAWNHLPMIVIASLTLIAVVIVVLVRGSVWVPGRPVGSSLLGILPLVREPGDVPVLAVGAVGLAGIALFWAVARSLRPSVALATAGIILTLVSATSLRTYVYPSSRYFSTYDVVPKVISEMTENTPTDTCVAMDAEEMPFLLGQYQMMVPGVEFLPITVPEAERCRLLVAPGGTALDGARRTVGEVDGTAALWVRTGVSTGRGAR